MQYTLADNHPAHCRQHQPESGIYRLLLTTIEVLFSSRSSGVDAGDLRLNGVPATSVVPITSAQYQFNLRNPANGTVLVIGPMPRLALPGCFLSSATGHASRAAGRTGYDSWIPHADAMLVMIRDHDQAEPWYPHNHSISANGGARELQLAGAATGEITGFPGIGPITSTLPLDGLRKKLNLILRPK